MKKIKIIILASCLAVSLTACSQENAGTQNENSAVGTQYEKTKIRMSVIGTDRGIDGLFAKKMQEMLYEKSGGQVTMDYYTNGQLAGGSMTRSIEMLAAGAGFDLAILGETTFSGVNPAFTVTGLPFCFESYDEAYHFADTTGKAWQEKEYAKLGIRHLETFSNSIMQITNSKKEILMPEDMKNMKMRAGDSGQIAINRALGADAVNINFSELYSALQMGTVDGQMNGYQTMDSASLYEVQPYMTECNIIWGAYDLLANEERWNKMSPEVQELVSEVARECALWARDYVSEQESVIKQKFTDYGMQIHEATPEELQAFKTATQTVIDSYAEVIGEEAYRAWGLIE